MAELNPPSKTWCFTLNNYHEDDEQFLKDLEKAYLIYGREVGESGTPHLQGLIIFRKAMRLPALKKLLPKAHWEKTVAAENAMNYCMKDKDYYKEDNRRQGSRTDIAKYTDLIKTVGLKRACEEEPETALKYPCGSKFLFKMSLKDRSPAVAPHVIWLYGEAGSGKTKWVFDTYPEVYVKNCSEKCKWFDGYEQQAVCLLDDFRQNTFDWNFLLQLLDRYPLNVELKGEMIPFNSPIIVITTPRRPEHTFVNNGEDIKQLLRRITEVREVKAVTVTEVV